MRHARLLHRLETCLGIFKNLDSQEFFRLLDNRAQVVAYAMRHGLTR